MAREKKPRAKKKVEYKYLTPDLREAVMQEGPGLVTPYDEYSNGNWLVYSFGRRVILYGKSIWTSRSGALRSLMYHIGYDSRAYALFRKVKKDESFYLEAINRETGEYPDYRKLKKEMYQFAEELVEAGVFELRQL